MTEASQTQTHTVRHDHFSRPNTLLKSVFLEIGLISAQTRPFRARRCDDGGVSTAGGADGGGGADIARAAMMAPMRRQAADLL